MADVEDIATAIHSALEEIGVTGELKVAADGHESVQPVGDQTGDDVLVDVEVNERTPARS